MSRSLIIVIVSACLLLQAQAIPRMRREAGETTVARKQTNVVPADADSDSSSSEESPLKFKPRQVLMTTTLVDLVGLAKYVTEHGRPLFKKALAQLEALPEKSPALQANITRIADYLNANSHEANTAEAEGMLSLFDSMITLTSILEDANEMSPELEQTKTVQKAFTDNGADKFEEDLMAELKVVSGKFEKAIEKYFETLNEEQKAKETKLIDWYTRFTNEKDDEKKAEYYANFFDTFKP
ncbi:uncharacterized protein LOC118735837 [Rhagoletis pomonella]|uniref:uncharacterized protein LOC118735837 n=1 Tax=Rhagoletis pomonella TaxID=28610 RepID=UPI001781C29A|nr:uncharacterized protein LOC118735837 [Rhagoletis pomonella]